MEKTQFSSFLERFNSDLWHFHIKVPKKIVEKFQHKNQKRLICRMNDEVNLHCAFMSAGDGEYFINVNKEIRKKLNLDIGGAVKCSIWADESKYGMLISEEMEAVLESDSLGNKLFHALTPGKQRSLIFIVSKFKSSDKRIEKSLIIMNHLVANQGKLDFKALNEGFRQGL